jgi:hypothetical protein
MAVISITIGPDAAANATTFSNAYAAAAIGDTIEIDNTHATDSEVIELPNPFYWTKPVTIRAKNRGPAQPHPFLGALPNFFKRRVIFRMLSRAATGNDVTKLMRWEGIRFERPRIWPNFTGTGETWGDLLPYPKARAIFDALDGNNDAQWQMIGCEAFGGYGGGGNVNNPLPYDTSYKYPDLDSPATYYSRPGNLADTKGRFSIVQDGYFTVPFSVGGWGDAIGSLRNKFGNLIYNALHQAPNLFSGYFNQFYTEDCYWHDIGVPEGIVQERAGGPMTYESKACVWENITNFCSQVSRNRPGGSTFWWDRPIVYGMMGHALDLGNPHSDAFFPGSNIGDASLERHYQARLTKAIILPKENERTWWTAVRNQPAPYSHPGIYAQGHQLYYSFLFQTAGYQFDISSMDFDAVGNILAKARHYVSVTSTTPGGETQNGLLWVLAGTGDKPTRGRIRGNITETLINTTGAVELDNIRLNYAGVVTAFANPTAPAETLEQLYQNYRYAANTTIPAEFRNPYPTVAALRASASVASVPPFAAPVSVRGAVANTVVTSNMFIKHGGDLGDVHVFTPPAGLEWRELSYDGSTQTRAWGTAPGPVVTGRLMQFRTTSSPTANGTVTKTGDLGGVPVSWSVVTATANKWPGAVLNETRLVLSPQAGLKDKTGTRFPGNQRKGSLFVVYKNQTGQRTDGKRPYLLHERGGDGAPCTFIVANPNEPLGNNPPTTWAIARSGAYVGALAEQSGGSGVNNNDALMIFAMSWDADAGLKQCVHINSNGQIVDASASMALNPGEQGISNQNIWTLFQGWDTGTNNVFGADFRGDFYALGLNIGKFTDWKAGNFANFNKLFDPDGVGYRFNALDPDGEDWTIAVVGDAARLNGGTANLNPLNPFVPDTAFRGDTTKASVNAVDKAVTGATLPGTKLAITAEVLTAKPSVGRPVQVLVQFSGSNAPTQLTPTWGGVARTSQDGVKAAPANSNGIVLEAVPSAAGNLTLSLANDQGHTNPAQVVIPVVARDPRATVNFTVSPASGQAGNPFATSLKVYDPA